MFSSSSGSGSGSSSGGSGCGRGDAIPTTTSGMLATVHEDTELTSTGPEQPLPLTRDMLMVTQKRRAAELRPKPEAYAGYEHFKTFCFLPADFIDLSVVYFHL